MNYIDFHTVLLPVSLRSIAKNNLRDELDGIKYIYNNKRDRAIVMHCSAESLLRSMGKNGVSRSVAMGFAWRSQKRCMLNNDYVAKVCNDTMGKIYGLAVVNPRHKNSLKELRYRVEKEQFIGVKFKAEWQGFAYTDFAVLDPIMSYLVKKRKLCMLHIAQGYQPHQGNHPYELHAFLKRYSSVRVIAAHMGGLYGVYALYKPFQQRFKNLYFDISMRTFPRILEAYTQCVAPEQLLFASDYPFCTQSYMIAQLKKCEISQSVKKNVAQNNAARLLNYCGAL